MCPNSAGRGGQIVAGTMFSACCYFGTCGSHGGYKMAMAMDEREFGYLIGSDKVEGTAVYGPDSTKIGSIERVMMGGRGGGGAGAGRGGGGGRGRGGGHGP